mmetsp:Transcript_44641/g.95252  ORF Transcript_44641/g.95252 Transcript_44641/m.95252 type:complete len:771 (-) Transcript_44641:40-2352(-)
MRCTAVAFFSGVAATSNTTKTSLLQDGRMNPIAKVLGLLKNMKSEVEEEGAKDKELFEKMDCWCKSNDAQKRAAMDAATKKIAELQSSIEEGVSTESKLSTEIEAYTDSRAKNQDSLKQATEMRDKENAEFTAEEKELVQAISQLGGAVEALEKNFAEFMQTKSEGSKKQVEQALMQTSNIVQTYAAKYSDVMDLDVAAINDAFPVAQPHEDAFTQGEQQRPSASLMTDVFNSLMAVASKKVGMLQQPADYKSYNAQSGKILGILKQMKETMEGDLADLTKQENESIAGFNGLNAAKNREIQASTDAIEENMKKSGEYAVGIVTMKGNKEDTEDALASDEGYLTELEKGCEDTMKDYELVKQSRSEELAAVADTINILNDDDALDLFKKALPTPESFLQMDATSKQLRSQAAAIIRKSGRNPRLDLITMALQSKKTSFDKVVKMVDDMVDALHKEQSDDDSKKDYCHKELHNAEQTKTELAHTLKTLANEISDHNDNLARLHKQVEELEQGIKDLDKAVEDATQNRKDEHEEYLVELQQNQATLQVLDFAKNRLNKFYNPKDYKAAPKRELTEEERMYSAYGGDIGTTPAPGGIAGSGAMAFVQIRAREEDSDVAKPPPAPKVGGFKKQNASGGVLGMIDMIVQDLKKEMQEHEFEEKQAQEDYEKLMEDSAAKRAADAKSISAREGTIAEREQDLQSAKDASMGKMKEFQENQEYMADVHKSCDFLLENFGKRKEARAQEVEGLKKAKAILAGADVSLLETSSFMHRRQ